MSWITEEIRERGGAVSFRDFMELALYHERHGYYSSESSRYGRSGDFLTAPTASRWYGDVIASWLERISKREGPLTVVDLGSGDGSLIARLLAAHSTASSPWLEGLVSVERSDSMRRTQQERFRGSSPSPLVLPPSAEFRPSGPLVIHACELHDATPVHRVVARGSEINELWVESAHGELAWRERPAPVAVVEYFASHGVKLQDGQIAEANLAAEPDHRGWLERAAAGGLALTLDYGYESRRLYHPRGRAGGSLACYRNHRLGRDPLAAPGEQDLTAHVNWDDLRRGARETGWLEIGLWPLAEFLVRAGIERVVDEGGIGMTAELDARTVTERQEIKRLLDPDGMGSDLKVLVQGKGELADAAGDTLDLF